MIEAIAFADVDAQAASCVWNLHDYLLFNAVAST